ncbi:photosystem II reaction center PsbP [Prochlorococcus sp. MIT 1341]|uniref:photosystem II reaction center PsbP n=1 Tax=Prochlorococcus sp. MIT 1341 TaxID=3096221 RepID=UPI002A761CE2|nr:photosystem II reaction center PsbP [Prochlorococcus sp. MIT 1341]
MVNFLRTSSRFLFAFFLAILLVACNSNTGGMESFQSPDGRYAFLYPTGWTRVAVNDGPQVVFHDLINSDETLSLVVSKVDESIDLSKLGDPDSVGVAIFNNVIAPEGTGREIELVEAKARDNNDHTFYDLEYIVHLQNRDRHELATVVIDRGTLYTLATSTNETRWLRVKNLFETVVTSLTFLI